MIIQKTIEKYLHRIVQIEENKENKDQFLPDRNEYVYDDFIELLHDNMSSIDFCIFEKIDPSIVVTIANEYSDKYRQRIIPLEKILYEYAREEIRQQIKLSEDSGLDFYKNHYYYDELDVISYISKFFIDDPEKWMIDIASRSLNCLVSCYDDIIYKIPRGNRYIVPDHIRNLVRKRFKFNPRTISVIFRDIDFFSVFFEPLIGDLLTKDELYLCKINDPYITNDVMEWFLDTDLSIVERYGLKIENIIERFMRNMTRKDEYVNADLYIKCFLKAYDTLKQQNISPQNKWYMDNSYIISFLNKNILHPNIHKLVPYFKDEVTYIYYMKDYFN